MDQRVPPTEESTARPDKTTQRQSKNRYKTWSIVLGGLLVVSLVGVGVLARMLHEQSSGLKSADGTISHLFTENSSLKNAQANSEGKNGPNDQVTLTDREQAELAASTYYCAIKDFGCDKVAASVTKIQPATATSAAFAIVKAGSSEGATNFYVKSIDGVKWAVIYDGQNTPPQEIIDKFGIPAGFAQ